MLLNNHFLDLFASVFFQNHINTAFTNSSIVDINAEDRLPNVLATPSIQCRFRCAYKV